ncbi:MAG TPA: non-homologous end-joining DNA ligase, partial [Segetibacter sp.]|nr:non-homologous end-joining DNA ligase [Segetibacter sp.]
GFDTELLKDLSAKLEPIITDQSPFEEKVKTNMPVTWVEPKYVCEIKFTEWTSDGKLRHPIFLRLREDKSAKDVTTQFINANQMNSTNSNEIQEEPVKEEKTVKASAKKAAPKKAASKKEAGQEAAVKSPAKKVKAAAVKKTSKPKTADKKASKAVTSEGDDVKAVVKNENEKIYVFGKSELKSTNITKVFFPDEGITKGEVLDYYERMASLIIPYLKDRPESLFRTPNGINQKGFFQKDAGSEAPSWVKHIPLYSDSVNKDIDYILCNDAATLLYLANLGCIEINPWHSRIKSLDNPDYLIIDIDPSDNNTFEQVIEAAQVVKQILDQAGATSICKTSGASGLHIYVPLGGKYDYDQAKDFANIVCMMANAQIPEFTTLERSLTKRSKNQIYMDYLQNRKGQTIACVYSLRPKKGATVSTPLDWSEVKKGLSPQQFTIYTIEERIKKKGDLFAPMLDIKNAVDLGDCIEKLGG